MKQFPVWLPIAMISVLLCGLVACDLIDGFTQFDLSYQTEVVVPASAGINLPFDLYSPEVETDTESEFAINDTRKDLVEEIRLTALGLKLTSPNNADFSFLESIAVYLSAEGQEEVLLGSLDPVPGASDSLALTPTDADLTAYLVEDKISLRVNTMTDEFLTTDHRIRATAKFFVDAKVLGQ